MCPGGEVQAPGASVTGEYFVFIADDTVEEEEKEAMGRKLLRVQNTWSPGKMALAPLAIPDLSSERF